MPLVGSGPLLSPSPFLNQALKANAPAESYLQGGDTSGRKTQIVQQIAKEGKKRAFVVDMQPCSPAPTPHAPTALCQPWACEQ